MYEIVMAVITALVLSLIIYLGKEKEEVFQPYKLVRTLAVGAVLGVIAYSSGYTLTADNWEAYLAANTSIIVIADVVVKAAWRKLAPSGWQE